MENLSLSICGKLCTVNIGNMSVEIPLYIGNICVVKDLDKLIIYVIATKRAIATSFFVEKNFLFDMVFLRSDLLITVY